MSYGTFSDYTDEELEEDYGVELSEFISNNQIMGAKWVAYAKAKIEGEDYYFSFDFNLPYELYAKFLDFLYKRKPIRSFPGYKEVLTYAQSAIDYRAIAGIDDEEIAERKYFENDEEFFYYLMKDNTNRNMTNADLIYIRLFDPFAEKDLREYFLALPVKKEYAGKTREFDFRYFEGESYSWTVTYDDDLEASVSRVKCSGSDYDTKYLDGENSMYPPYEIIMEELKKGTVYSRFTENK